jgi:hypothetical protein
LLLPLMISLETLLLANQGRTILGTIHLRTMLWGALQLALELILSATSIYLVSNSLSAQSDPTFLPAALGGSDASSSTRVYCYYYFRLQPRKTGGTGAISTSLQPCNARKKEAYRPSTSQPACQQRGSLANIVTCITLTTEDVTSARQTVCVLAC